MKGNLILTEEQSHQFNHSLEMLDSTLSELRRISRNLMPESLIKFGLIHALSDFCEDLGSQAEPRIRFQVYGDDRRFPPELEVTAFRVVQELVTNSLKHAEASEINVVYIAQEGRLSLQVMDDGKGFDLSQVDGSKSNGLKNIRDRVKAAEGTLDLQSSPGNGTEALIEFSYIKP